MQQLALYEHIRTKEQGRCDADRSAEQRNKLGQFATPTALANDMVRVALRYLGNPWPVRFVEPGFGTGVFYSALLQNLPPSRLEAAYGVETDPQYVDRARSVWGDTSLQVLPGDFTQLSPPAPCNLLACNPPYVRHHHMDAARKKQLSGQVELLHGLRPSKRMGLYGYFMLLADAWLQEGGVSAWLVPTEFCTVNYGEVLKTYLSGRVQLLRMHHFDHTASQFDDALVSSTVVWFRKQKPAADARLEISCGGTVAQPLKRQRITLESLQARTKWTRGGRQKRAPKVTLGDLFDIRRGIATGGNSFFVLTAEQMAAAKLPREHFRPILPNSRFIPSNIIAAEADGTPQLERQRFLLDCTLTPEEAQLKAPGLWAYLQGGEATVGQGYLCRHRKPWYAQENRDPPLFLCTYMGRSGMRFLWNQSQAIAANTYLLLYPGPDLKRRLADSPATLERLWQALSALTAADLAALGRTYGGGLHKVEPRELAKLPADELLAALK